MRNINILLIIFSICCFCIMVSCGDRGEDVVGTDLPDIPEYTNLSLANLPDSKILDVPTRKSLAGLCYIESFSMQIAYIDNSITIQEVVAFSGSGAILSYDSYLKAFKSEVPYPQSAREYQLKNYGVHYILGSAHGYSRLYNNAHAKITYKNADDALKYLKAVINSGRPAQVYIDLGYMHSHPKFPNIQPGKGSHWILVTGYDSDGIYMNETYDENEPEDKYKNFEIPVEEFLTAWEKGGNLASGEDQSGPYWMMFIEEKTKEQLINKKSIADVLAMQKGLSANNSSTIENNLDSDFSGTHWNEIASLKESFGNFLIDNGYTEAGNIYKELGTEYRSCNNLSRDGIKTKLNTEIKSKEIEARIKY
ncbi:hypothetical protein [Melioribacter sp. OK-6-Me]|uniref:hypothetical protein n=1 Tax=unclassified Melioribacter TaxID=2627329 RepID=UPI003ED9D434